jgi:hypothetical protein
LRKFPLYGQFPLEEVAGLIKDEMMHFSKSPLALCVMRSCWKVIDNSNKLNDMNPDSPWSQW